MKIIQLADCHIGEELSKQLEIAQYLFHNAVELIEEREQVAICVCGDIIDKGSKGNSKVKYDNARRVFKTIKKELDHKRAEYRIFFVPGNHDIVKTRNCFGLRNRKVSSFKQFCSFAQDITGVDYSAFMSDSSLAFDFGGIKWVLCNSAYHNDIKYGLADIQRIKETNTEGKPTVFLIHHTFFSDGEKDSSALRNGYQLVSAMQSNTIALLHGHTHGFKNIKIGNNCLVVGCGPFLKEVSGINRQLNILDISLHGVHIINNIYWREDIAEMEKAAGPIELYRNNQNIMYSSHNLKELVQMVTSDVEQSIYQYNTTINYDATLEEMGNQIQSDYSVEYNEALEWQQETCPKTLYNNHGELIHRIGGLEYIKRKLIENPTCRRALITLIDQNTVQNSGDGYLPSFDVVQFGFPDETRGKLIISLYMRALEVSHFLPINLCELYYLAKHLHDENITITAVNISIFAHRATIIKDYDGFRKARIDMLTTTEIKELIIEKRYSEIIELLREKQQKRETVFHTEGITNLSKLMLFSSDTARKGRIKNKIDNLLAEINHQTREREKHSNNYEKEFRKPYENTSIFKAYSALIQEFERGKSCD